MESRQTRVQRGEPGTVATAEVCKVCIGHLPVPHHACQRHVLIRGVVGPELVTGVATQSAEDGHRRVWALTLADEQPQEAALGYRTGRELQMGSSGGPVLCRIMMHVIADRQSD